MLKYAKIFLTIWNVVNIVEKNKIIFGFICYLFSGLFSQALHIWPAPLDIIMSSTRMRRVVVSV
ncbi:MAG: hypothetical protein KAW93_08630, partial [Methanogenium sp.]|nr:hypothetical protein [Methanogenium sp.]